MFAIFRRGFKDFELFFNHLENFMSVSYNLKDFPSVEVRISGDNAPVVFMKDRKNKVVRDGNDIFDHHEGQNHMLRPSLCRKKSQVKHHLIITDTPMFEQGLQPSLDFCKFQLNG